MAKIRNVVGWLYTMAFCSSVLWSFSNGDFNSPGGRTFSSGNSNSLWQLSQFFSLYESEHDAFLSDMEGEEHNHESKNIFSEDEIDIYREIFKFVPNLSESPFGDILEHSSFPLDNILQDGNLLEVMFTKLIDSEEIGKLLNHKLSSFYFKYPMTVTKDDWKERVANDHESSYEDTERFDSGQVGGWEGCRRDYNALALPWTNNILGRVGRTVIGREFPEETVDCLEACDTVCQNFTTIADCVPPCTLICDELNSRNATYNDVVDYLIDAIFPPKNKTSWHRSIFDAMAKVPPGIVDGNLHWVGAYDRCYSIEVSHTYTEENSTGLDIAENRYFTGQYYRIPLKPPVFQNMSLEILYGACLPSTCSKDDVIRYVTEENDLFRILKNALNWEINDKSMFNGTHVEEESTPAGIVILLIFLVFTLFLMVLPATVYDIYFRESIMRKHVEEINKVRTAHRRRLLSQMSYASSMDSNNEENPSGVSGGHQKPPLFHSVSTQSTKSLVDNDTTAEIESTNITIWDRLEVLFVAFSGYSNFIRMFRIKNLDTDLPALDCVRFLSYAWTITGLTWLLGPVTGGVWLSANLFYVLKNKLRSWSFQAIVNFHFASDSFYLISGILVAYWWLIKLNGKKLTIFGWVKTVLLFYLHRYWRMVPALLFVILFYTTTYKVFTGGPFSSSEIGDAENCKANWWTNLLMLNNLVNTDQSCVTWNWYLSTLFQLLVMSPLVLVPLVIKPMLGYIALVAVYIIHVAITAGVIGSLTGEDNLTLGTWVTDYFFTPWCRAGPYFVGMAYGIILQKTQKQLKMPKWVAFVGSILSMGLIVAVIYGTYGQFKEGGQRWDRDAQVMYNTFARSVYALGLGFIVLLACTENGGFIGELLNWRGFQPLSRLTFCAFLFCSPLLYTQAFSRLDPFWLTSKAILHMTLTNMVTTFVVGFLFTGCCIHYPYSLGIERAFRVKTKADCIKAGRHPELMAISPPASGAMPEPSTLADISYLYNTMQPDDGGSNSEQKPYGRVQFNRQDSITSL